MASMCDNKNHYKTFIFEDGDARVLIEDFSDLGKCYRVIFSVQNKKYEFLNRGKNRIILEDDYCREEIYVVDGEIHREREPAYIIEYKNFQRTEYNWIKNGKYHRNDGPAIYHDQKGKLESIEWFYNGIIHDGIDSYLKVTRISDERKMFLKLKWPV